MKKLIAFVCLISLISVNLCAQENIVLKKGLYELISGNNDSICPQQIKTFTWDKVMTGLSVTFVGDCYEWGPFEVPCDSDKNTCNSPGLFEYTILSEKSFIWRNTAYDIYGEFRLVE